MSCGRALSPGTGYKQIYVGKPSWAGEMNKIMIQEVKGPCLSEMDVEIVERKGLGHPDTICDSVMEHLSQTLSKVYLERFGRILHHNCDKGLLAAGRVERRLGGGKVLEPMRLVIGDRATDRAGAESLDIPRIAVEAAKVWFHKHLRWVDPDQHLQYQVELRPVSEALGRLFETKEVVMGSNDTSAAVGYAPLTETERLVLGTEHFLNSPDFKARFPETGEDVKVMGVRLKNRLTLTVAMPFLDRYIDQEADYFRLKERVHEVLRDHLSGQIDRIQRLDIHLNTLDCKGIGMSGMYLSVIGTSAEDSDSGQVGRGNQVNGVIALNRPRGSEAAAGKNPVSHVGKIYNVLTHVLAHRIHAEIQGIRDVTVWLYTRIGDPVDYPQVTSVQVHLKKGASFQDIQYRIQQLLKDQFARIPDFSRELAEGQYPIC